MLLDYCMDRMTLCVRFIERGVFSNTCMPDNGFEKLSNQGMGINVQHPHLKKNCILY